MNLITGVDDDDHESPPPKPVAKAVANQNLNDCPETQLFQEKQ